MELNDFLGGGAAIPAKGRSSRIYIIGYVLGGTPITHHHPSDKNGVLLGESESLSSIII